MRFTTTLDTWGKFCSTITTIFIAAIILVQFVSIDSNNQVAVIAISSVLAFFHLGSFLLRTRAYIVTNEAIIIERRLYSKYIPMDKIKRVLILEDKVLKSTIMISGTPGLFGYYGKFYNRKLGTMTSYATRRDKNVLIETVDKKKIIVSPDNPIQFIQYLRAICVPAKTELNCMAQSA